jgi:hypothetical protein
MPGNGQDSAHTYLRVCTHVMLNLHRWWMIVVYVNYICSVRNHARMRMSCERNVTSVCARACMYARTCMRMFQSRTPCMSTCKINARHEQVITRHGEGLPAGCLTISKYTSVVALNGRLHDFGEHLIEHVEKQAFIFWKTGIYILKNRHLYFEKQAFIFWKTGIYILKNRHLYFETWLYPCIQATWIFKHSIWKSSNLCSQLNDFDK